MIEKITNIPKNSLSKVPFNLIPKWIKTNKRNTTKSFFSDIKLPPSNDNIWDEIRNDVLVSILGG